MKRHYLTLFILFIFCLTSSVLEAQVLTIGNTSFTGSNFAGPMNTSTSANASSRYAYIYPASVVSALKHGDSIRSISFHRNGGGGSVSGNSNLKIFMRTTVNSNYGTGNINWVNRTSSTGMTKVYDESPNDEIDSTEGWKRFTFSTPFVFDTIFGTNLEILVEYTQVSAQMNNVFWSFENSGTVSGFTSNQTKFFRTNGGTLSDTSNSSTEWHPSLRIEFPRNDFDVSVVKLYSLGKLPIPQGNPDTVKALVFNVGKKPANFKMYLKSNGANDLLDSAVYSLGYLEEKVISLPLLFPNNVGLDTLSGIMEDDDDSSNNIAQSFRLTTEFMYSYKDPTRPVAGGIGFNGSTGDFVAKFYSANTKAINQISVAISGSNQRFKLGIWDVDSLKGTPKNLVWQSDTLTPAPTFIASVDPPVQVKGNFYVGVRQLGNVNVGFGYQPESPVRKNTFFYASPLGDTNWIDFSPDAPFKFVIEPRIQADDDVAPLSYDFPKDTLWLFNTKVMAPKATFINYGLNDQNTNFNVKMTIHRFGNQEFTSTRSISLKSGEKKVVTFDSSFHPLSAGQYDVTMVTSLSGDQIKDNDTLRSRLIVAAFKDVGPGTIFDPSSGYDYEQFVDTIYPTVYIQNYGLDNQGPFGVRAEIYDSLDNLIYGETKSFTLTALNSVLASFTPFPCDVRGVYKFRAFTMLGIDVDKTNDTVRRTFKIIRSNDVAITSIGYPADGTSLIPPVAAKKPEAVLENLGEANQGDPFTSYCDIWYNNSLIYRDSFRIASFKGNPETMLFKNFQPTLKGYYTMKVYCSLPFDQYRLNDTMISNFAVGVPDDVEIVSISPAENSVIQLNTYYPTKFTIRNNGYNPQNTQFPVIFKVSSGASIKYVKVLNITLDSGETKEFIIDTTLRLTDIANYEVSVYSNLGIDFIKTNDTIKGIYTLAKNYDVGVDRILFPTDADTLLVNTQNVTPRILVRNFGDSLYKSTFRATFRVLNAANGVTIYNKFVDTMFVNEDSLELEFPIFNVSNSPLNINLISTCSFIGDQYIGNDTARGNSRFMIRYDIKADNIVLPASGATYVKSTPAIQPKLTLKSQGISTMPQFFARAIIKRQDTGSMPEVEVYRDSISVTGLASSATLTVDLLKEFIVKDQISGTYKCYFDILSMDDQVFVNNKTQNSFTIDNTIGINSINIGTVLIYPNPSSETLNIYFSNSLNVGIDAQIVDIGGKVIKSFRVESQEVSLDVSDLASGVYFVKIGNGLIKFVVE